MPHVEPILEEDTRTRLERIYRDDLVRLPDLIGRRIDLEGWTS